MGESGDCKGPSERGLPAQKQGDLVGFGGSRTGLTIAPAGICSGLGG